MLNGFPNDYFLKIYEYDEKMSIMIVGLGFRFEQFVCCKGLDITFYVF